MKNAEVVRSPKNGNYTCMSNEHVFDTRISELESRLMSVILAVSESWVFTTKGMAKILHRGEKAIKKAVAHLAQVGYAHIEQPREKKTGHYQDNKYTFYETPEVNPHLKKIDLESQQQSEQNPENEILEIPENRDFNRCPKTVEPLRNDRKGVLSNTNKLNTDRLNSQSVSPVEQTDGLTTQPKNSNKTSATKMEIITILRKNIIEINQEFVENTANYLSSAISKGIISLNAVTDKLNAIISKEHSLDSFMHTIDEKCTHALKNLKHSHAKYNYIRKTVANILREYEPESPELTQPVQQSTKQADTPQTTVRKNVTNTPQGETMPKTLSFRELLIQLHCSLPEKYADEEYYGISFESAEKFWEEFDAYAYDYNVSECTIDEDLRHNPENMENALKFLMGWNTLKSGEFKSFSEYAISCLAEVLQTGKCCREKVNYHNLISYLNYINWGGKDEYERETNEESIYNFMESFFEYYCKKIKEYPPSSNKKGYLTRMLVNYLKGEYQAYHAHLHANLKNLNDCLNGDTQKNTSHNYDEFYESCYQRHYDRRY